MPELYLTPSSISNLTQFLLALIITVYLIGRSLGRGKKFALGQDAFLLVVFACFTLLSLLFFLEYSFLPSERFIVVCLENSVLAVLLAALIQFAYHFPIPTEKYKLERWIAFLISGYYIYREVAVAIHRFALIQTGDVEFRSSGLDTFMSAEFAWVVFVFVRNAIRNWKLPAIRNFALILLIPLSLAVLAYFRGKSAPITFLFPISLSIGLLITIFLFTLNYLSSKPERISFVVKISGAVLTSMLVVLGIIAWLVAPAYAERYVSPSQQLEHRSLHFSPDGQGGYRVSEIPFQWDSNYGRRVRPNVTEERVIDFDFPLFGQSYPQIHLSSYGTVGMGVHHFSGFQYHFNNQPMIIPLLVDLDENGGFFVSRENDRLILTWDNILATAHPEARYTVQTVLFPDGNFKISYNDLPDLKYYVDDRPESTAWAIGVKTQAPAPAADFTQLPMQIGSQGAVQDDYRSFRIYLHEFLFPIAIAVVASSFAFLAGTVLLLNYGLARPLKTLLEGVQKFDKGQHDAAIPIQTNDEIGTLTESFNKLGAELNNLIGGLEQRVSERTQNLADANARLHIEMEARVAAQEQVVEQHRAVAALEERERMARDLHDGIGQVLGFINVQGQSAIDFAKNGNDPRSIERMTRVVEVAQEAHDDMRSYILGLKKEASQPKPNFPALLEQYCQHLFQNFGFQTRLNLPAEIPSALATPLVETQLLYVIREALSNARAHSGQNQAEVTLTFDETRVSASIEDHGTGFAMDTSSGRSPSGHFGLGIMRERAEEVDGSLEIESASGGGTRVTICLPRHLGAESTSGRSILLVDDHPLFLEGMTNLMAGRGMRVVGTASDGLEALEKARELHPDVILMDIEMPRCNGLEATRRIKAEIPDVKIVMLTVSGEERNLFEALQGGASGYLLKSLDAAELTALLDELLRGEVSLSPSLAKKMLEAFTRHKAPPAQPPSAPAGLTERQMEILRLVADGLQYKQIGVQLGLAEVTVKYHMGEILARLHLNSKREAVRYFQENQTK